MVIWKEVPVLIRHKFYQIHKIGGRLYYKFNVDCGDIPVGRFNNITGKFEPCVNTRGLAYATRKRLKFYKRK